MGKTYEYQGQLTVFVEATFEDDGISDLNDQALEALKSAVDISESNGDGSVLEDNWMIERGSVREISNQ